MPDLDALSRDDLIVLLREAYKTIEGLVSTVSELKERVNALEDEITRVRMDPPTGGLEPMRRKQPAASEQKVRKKRGRGCSRMLEEPTQVRIHAADTCPDCG